MRTGVSQSHMYNVSPFQIVYATISPKVHRAGITATVKPEIPYPVLSSSTEMTPLRRTFTVIAHTADVAVEVYGRDIRELFINAAHALNAILFDSFHPDGDTLREVTLDSADDDTLLVDWLNELIYLFDAERLAFARFDIVTHSPGRLVVRCGGRVIDDTCHAQVREVKAATYHGVHIDATGNGLTATVIFDV